VLFVGLELALDERGAFEQIGVFIGRESENCK